MAAVWMRARAELRASWRSVVVLAVLLGLGSGVALAALAGARRTDTAIPRFFTYYRAENAGVVGDDLAAVHEVVSLPEVAVWERGPYVVMSDSPHASAHA